jgi:2-keto-4-pentenoate hydratase/2-oxohepta-3-ene-1,7-dioic acid hydratase in catechol pathway
MARDLSGLTADIDGPFLAEGGVARARAALGTLPAMSLDGVRVGSPIARPQAVWCVGMNYAAHAAEGGSLPPDVPILFLKTPNCVVGPDDDVLLPRTQSGPATAVDWEVELAVVIGTRARYLESPEAAMAHVAGYATSNDVSERDFQLKISGGQWSKGKCAETFNPLGPWLVPSDEVDPANLRLRSWVNGDPRQDSSTGDMIFDVPYLVWYISQFAVLEPGDVINTGTPQGVGLSGRFPYLQDGDVVEIEVEALGRQRQRVRAGESPLP